MVARALPIAAAAVSTGGGQARAGQLLRRRLGLSCACWVEGTECSISGGLGVRTAPPAALRHRDKSHCLQCFQANARASKGAPAALYAAKVALCNAVRNVLRGALCDAWKWRPARPRSKESPQGWGWGWGGCSSKDLEVGFLTSVGAEAQWRAGTRPVARRRSWRGHAAVPPPPG